MFTTLRLYFLIYFFDTCFEIDTFYAIPVTISIAQTPNARAQVIMSQK